MLCRHRHLAANRASPAVGRASPVADRASPVADRASPVVDRAVDGRDAAAYSPVYQKVADPLADYTSYHKDVDYVAENFVDYFDDCVVDYVADQEVVDRVADREVADSVVDGCVNGG